MEYLSSDAGYLLTNFHLVLITIDFIDLKAMIQKINYFMLFPPTTKTHQILPSKIN